MDEQPINGEPLILSDNKFDSDQIPEGSQKIPMQRKNYVSRWIPKAISNFFSSHDKERKNDENPILMSPKKQIVVQYKGTRRQIEYENIQMLLKQINDRMVFVDFDKYEVILNQKQKITHFSQDLTGDVLWIIPKRQKYFRFNNSDSLQEIWLQEKSNGEEIKNTILKKLKSEDPSIKKIELTFKMQKKLIHQISNLSKDERNYGELKQILVVNFVQIIVHYKEEQANYEMKTTDTIYKLRKLLEARYFPIEAQSIYYQNPQSLLLKKDDNQKTLGEVMGEKKNLHIELKNTHTKEFYGFHENRRQSYYQFSQFYLEQQKQVQQVIRNSDFSQKSLEDLFSSVLIKRFYSGIKKRFSFESTLQYFRKEISEIKKQDIWIPHEQDKFTTVNQSFVAMYLLYNSDEKLRITLMKLLTKQMPLPIYFRKFENILNVSKKMDLNNELIWTLKEGITLLSISLHNEETIDQEKGQSNLLNHLFYTNFSRKQNKHKITQAVPYISVDIYNQLFPLNIIDTPSDCPEYIYPQLFKCANVVMIHSWKSQEKTLQIKKRIQEQFEIKAFVIMRDSKKAQEDLKNLAQKEIGGQSFVQLKNIKGELNKYQSLIRLLRNKINNFLGQIAKKINNKGMKKILNISGPQNLQRINKINQAVEKLFTCHSQKLLKFVDKRNAFDREGLFKSQREKLEKKKQLLNSGLHPVIIEIIEWLSYDQNIQISLDYFRQRVREYQNKEISKYMKIYSLKKKAMEFQSNTKILQAKINQIHQQLKKLPNVYLEKYSVLKKPQQQVQKIFQEMELSFQNNIKPRIFSIELFWRQIYSFLELSKEIIQKSKRQKMLNTVIKLKNKEIMNNQSFQIIDGDSLKIPKQIMYKVFNPKLDKCLVLSILGPQSSGKSTLLNFLFGCDFATSQGRCTRGVYGTFFKVNDNSITNFDGIFVIDTEGLFAVTNEKDEKEEFRKQFDSKLVLFCLAVSDIVIINVKGNLESHTQKILNLCNSKMKALNQSDEKKPEIAIVLNQNSTTKTEQSENQFRKIKKTFDFQIKRSLTSAYIVKKYNKQDISLLPQNQILQKNISQSVFRAETCNLLDEIMVCLKKKKNAEKIIDRIDKFQSLWSTILAFPNLSKMKTKQYFQLQKSIKKWKKEMQENNYRNCQAILTKVKNNQITAEIAQQQLEAQNQKYRTNYQQKFHKQKTNQQLSQLILTEQKQIRHQNQINVGRLNYQINKINQQKKMNRQKFEGDMVLRLKQNQIIKNQDQYTEKDKEDQFNQYFQKEVEKIKKSLRLPELYQNQWGRIRKQYDLLIKTNKSCIKEDLGLPKEKYQIRQQLIQSKLKEGQIALKNIFVDQNKAEQFMHYVDMPHLSISKQKKSQQKLKYFDIEKYFKYQYRYVRYNISKQQIANAFRKQKFFSDCQKSTTNKIKQELGQQTRLQQIFKDINNYFQNFHVQISQFSNFKAVYSKNHSKIIEYKYLFGKPKSIELKISRLRKTIKEPQHSQILESLKKIKNKYVHIDKPLSLFNQYQIKDSNEYCLNFNLQKYLQKSIKWDKIEEKCQNNKTKGKQKLYFKDIIKKLSKDLQQLNLKIDDQFSCDQLQDKLSNNLQFLNFIPTEQTHYNTPQKFEGLCKKWGDLQYFNGKHLNQNLKSSQFSIKEQDQVTIGIVKYQYPVVINKQFEYNKGDALDMKYKYKSLQFRSMIFKELQKTGSIQKLCINIFQNIQKIFQTWGSFSTSSISQMFNKVNSQITSFNDDLSQVSYQMTPLMMGKIHLMAIYMIWKYQVDQITVRQKKLLQAKIQSRDAEFKKFMMRVSNKTNELIEEEVQSFQDKIAQLLKEKVQSRKNQIKVDEKINFKKHCSRQQILSEIDGDIFRKNKSPQTVLQYLQKPVEFISNKYYEKYIESWQNIVDVFEKQQYHKLIKNDLEDFLKYLEQKLNKGYQINNENGTARDIFEMKGIFQMAGEKDYEEQGKKLLFSLLIDSILDHNPQKDRKCLDLIVKPRIQFLRTKKLQNKISIQLISKMYCQNMKITNLPKFISLFLSEKSMNNFQQKLTQVFSFGQLQQRQFFNEIRVIICSEKCPCCGRICGKQKDHTFHECLYGHQMRALAGNFIKRDDGKKEAFVATCNQLAEDTIMEFTKIDNTKQIMTWTQFKSYWANKPMGGWDFNDTQQQLNQSDKKRFQAAWLIAGPFFCQKNGLQFVNYNHASVQTSKALENIHFIFALDESGSMSGERWKNLMNVLYINMKKIKQYNQKGAKCFVTIITFNHTYQTIYEKVKPQDVDYSKIKFRSGGTDFDPVFSKAAQIAQNYINKETIAFIFMTDGQASYPKIGVGRFQRLSKDNPKKFKYHGIQYASDCKNMKNIAMALGGNNSVANNFDELLQAYSSFIEVIARRQKPQDGMVMMMEQD